ncbi:glycogen/starch/alpha-glucan phosphorylase [Chamaesiphon sp.]|uniref:glycogen/starch/alpha-glucan phosphorylase n=1 Tax=Chamaesiphon sp. TaxID=2814140 RepID=UPI0035931EAB
MIENMNVRVGIGGSFLSNTQIASADLLPKLQPSSRNRITASPIYDRSVPRTIARNRERWMRDPELVEISPPSRCVHQSSTRIAPDVNPCQWLLSGNPRLANLVTETIGDRWIAHSEDLQQLAPLADNPLFQLRWRAVKQANKQVLANSLYQSQGIRIDVNSLFDLQLARIGGHQRQLLNLLHIINTIDRIKQNPHEILPRTFIFGELEEPQAVIDLAETEDCPLPMGDYLQYHQGQQQMAAESDLATFGLIKSLAETVAADPDLSEKLQVVYIPATAGLTSQMYAAADLTQQIATAAVETLDLSALRGAINGVISIGSLGKTNYWLQQLVGEHNCFRFGLAIPEIALFKEYGYDPYNYYKYYPQIRRAIDYLLAGHFTPNQPSQCRPIIDTLLGTDEHMVLADYIFYAACQAQVSETYDRSSLWTHMSIMNVAGVK